MSRLAQLQALAAQEAQTTADMNEATGGGGGGKLAPAGNYIGTLVEYIDCGSQPQEYQGEAKEPAPEIRLGVGIWGYEGGDQTKPLHDPTTNAPLIIRPYSMALKRNEKAGSFKAFKAMNYRQDPNVKHFAQFLGVPFIFKVTLGEVGKKKTLRNGIDWAGTGAAVDPMSGAPYALPAHADDVYKVFLWNNPDLETWNSLKIDGKNDDGSSKNFIQDTILSALDFPGSPLEQLLLSNNIAYSVPEKKAPATAAAAPVGVAAPAVGVTPAQTAVAAPVASPAVVAQPQQVASPLEQGHTTSAPPAQTATSVDAPGNAQPSGTTTSRSEVAPTIAGVPTIAPIPAL